MKYPDFHLKKYTNIADTDAFYSILNERQH